MAENKRKNQGRDRGRRRFRSVSGWNARVDLHVYDLGLNG